MREIWERGEGVSNASVVLKCNSVMDNAGAHLFKSNINTFIHVRYVKLGELSIEGLYKKLILSVWPARG